MIILSILSVVLHAYVVKEVILFCRSENCRSSDQGLVAGLGVSCTSFILIQALYVVHQVISPDAHPSLIESTLTAFFLLNGVIYLNVVRHLSQDRERRSCPNPHQPPNLKVK